MSKIDEIFSRWIFDSFSVSPEALGLYRIFTALFILCFLLPSTEMYSFLGSIPNDFYAPPPGPMWFFEGFPSEGFFYFLHGILIILLVLLLIGYKTPWVSIFAGVVLLIIKGFFYSLGKINHDLLLALVPIVMSFSGWGKAYSIDSLRQNGKADPGKVESWPLTLLALFIGFMMFTAGFAKLVGGWLYTETQATMGHLFSQYFVKNRQDLLASYILSIDNRIIWELLDYATVIFEIGFLVAIFHPRATKLFVSFAVLFHFSIMITMNISFLPNFLAYAAFLNWILINKNFKKFLPIKFASPVLLTGSFFLIGTAIWLGNSFGIPELESDLRIHEFYILLLALPIAISYVIFQIKDMYIQFMSD
jgi:uncharacterized membrane protein YphA (DoxX/SURF4 family)